MATVRKSKKKKIIIAVVIAVIIVAAAIGITIAAVENSIPQVSLYTVGTSDIYETVSATGEVSSGAKKEYKVGSVATVKEVFVNVGDAVKQGDLLATFDTSGFDSEIAKLQSSYNEARAGYKEAVENQKTAKKNLAEIEKQIAALEKENEKLVQNIKNDISNATNQTFPSVSVTNPTLPSDWSSLPSVSASIPDFTLPGVTYDADVQKLIDAVNELAEAIDSFTDDAEINSQIIEIVMDRIADEIEKGNVSSEEIAKIVSDAVNQAIKDGSIDSSIFEEEYNKYLEQLQNAVGNVNWNDIISSIEKSNGTTLVSNQLTLTAYYAQKQLYSAAASDTIVKAKKELMDTTKSALNMLNDAKQEMSAGWTAAFDGTITDCNLFAGEKTSLLSGGITLQNMNDMIITISLGEYDIHKVKVGMPVNVTTAYGKYTGSVISKAPVATGGSAGSILDSVGSMAGISGLSSLTSAGAGVEVQISVDNPDEFIVIGFDADVEIEVGEHIGITTVPSQAMILDKTGSYVFVYDEEEETVTKTLIETGASSVSEYEILSGVNSGDRIVLAPQSTYEDSFKVRIKD